MELMEGSESEYCPLYTKHSQLAAGLRAAFTKHYSPEITK